jgi:Fic family protein
MKLPVSPPDFAAQIAQILGRDEGLKRFQELLESKIGPAPSGKYRHWDTFRHAANPAYGSPDDQWIAIKYARRALYRPLPLHDSSGIPFVYSIPNVALEMLHRIDTGAGGRLQISEQVTNPQTRDTYLFRSIVEEAITSSQLEGASTTRRVAKSMIQEGRPPRTRSEKMILNNYEAMRYIRQFIDKPLTPELVFEVQRIVTTGTLDELDGSGRFRKADENIVIEDEAGARLHTPPPAAELPARLQAMCDFANKSELEEFIPPAIRAVLLHFWLAYDHPFVDGNGRTARALFYWSMARSGYWLCEYVTISRILKKARAQYARAYLYSESDDNDATYFILYQLKVLLVAIQDLHIYLARKAREIREADDLVRKASKLHAALNPRQLALVNHALKTPGYQYTIQSHQKSHDVSYETARSDLLGLAREGLVEQRKSGRSFAFVAMDDLRAKLEGTPTAAGAPTSSIQDPARG